MKQGNSQGITVPLYHLKVGLIRDVYPGSYKNSNYRENFRDLVDEFERRHLVDAGGSKPFICIHTWTETHTFVSNIAPADDSFWGAKASLALWRLIGEAISEVGHQGRTSAVTVMIKMDDKTIVPVMADRATYPIWKITGSMWRFHYISFLFGFLIWLKDKFSSSSCISSSTHSSSYFIVSEIDIKWFPSLPHRRKCHYRTPREKIHRR